MKKLIATILVLSLLSLAACGTANESAVIPEAEYGALYDKYMTAIDVGMIFNSTWDDANNVEPDYFLYYYAHSFLRSGGKIEVDEGYGMYIPENELESFVQSHFDVSTEHLRANEYYIAEKNAYEFGGLGSTWHCDITGAEQKGKLLTIKYDVIGPMDYVIGRGALVIEINGENYKYLSNEFEKTAQSDLDYPTEDYVNRYPEASFEQPLFDEAEIKAQFGQAVKACADIINSFEIDTEQSAYPMPTLAEYTQMSQAIGALGFPVDYYDLDMPNYEKAVAFYEDIQAGNDAQVVIYRLFNWGIVADVLVSRDGEQMCTSAVCNFPQKITEQEPEISIDEPIYKIDSLLMTEKGYLLYLIHNESPDTWPDNRGYRVLPLGDELRETGRKYVWGIGYLANKMLTENWDKDHLSALNMDWVFESLYFREYGKLPDVDYPESGLADSRILVPADVIENIMLNALPITKEQLRSFIPYDEARKTYAYQTFNGGGYSGIPEVVKAERNADGTLTLTVDAVAIEFGKDKSMTSVLTVMDNPDGSVKYLSNTAVMYD